MPVSAGRYQTAARSPSSRRSSASRSSGSQSAADMLAQRLAESGLAGLMGGGPQYLGGLPSSYKARIPGNMDVLGGKGPGGVLGHGGSVGPRYTAGEQYNLFQGKDPAYITRIQTQLVTAGLLPREHGAPGKWTPDTAAAMEKVMGHANYTGQHWQGALGDLVQAGEFAASAAQEGFAYAPFIPETYIEPDPKVARQKVKDLVTQIVGEEYVTEGIVDKYTSQLLTDYHRAFNQQEMLRREEYEAGRDIAEGQFNMEMGMGGSIPDEDDLHITNKVKAVDPEANLRARLEKRFAPVKEGIRQRELAEERQPSLYGSLNSLVNFGLGSEGNVL